MLNKIKNCLTPKSRFDVIGILLLIWVLIPFLNPFLTIQPLFEGGVIGKILQGLSNLLMYVALPPTMAAMKLFPAPANAELEAIIYMIVGFLLLIGLINLGVILSNLVFLKKFSKVLLVWTGTLIVTILVLNAIGMQIRSLALTNKYARSDERAKDIKVAVNKCTSTDYSGNYDYKKVINCDITLSNLPTDVMEDKTNNTYITVTIGSDEYEKMTREELEREANIPGTSKEYTYNVWQHTYDTLQADSKTKISDNTYSVNATFYTRDNITPESLYIIYVNLSKGYDIRYNTPYGKTYLFK